MSTSLDMLEAEVLKLTPTDRVRLLERLIASLAKASLNPESSRRSLAKKLWRGSGPDFPDELFASPGCGAGRRRCSGLLR